MNPVPSVISNPTFVFVTRSFSLNPGMYYEFLYDLRMTFENRLPALPLSTFNFPLFDLCPLRNLHMYVMMTLMNYVCFFVT